MPAGFVVAAVVMGISPEAGLGQAVVLAALPLVGLPVLDTTLVVISRTRRGVNVISGGRDHLTHRLLRWLHTPRAVALALGLTQAALCLIGLALFQAPTAVVLSVGALVVAAGGAALLVLDWSYEAEAPAALATPVQQESGS